MGHLYIVTHTDLDGAGSAAAALRAYGRKIEEATILYAEPYNIHEKLGDIIEYLDQGDILVVSDLGPNRASIQETLEFVAKAVEKGARVDWYDHHIWPEEWVRSMKEKGVNLTIDTSTCATGVVARYATSLNNYPYDDYMRELEAAVCAADLWRWDHPLAPKLFRVADTRYGEDKVEWRNRLVAKLSSGVLWDDELEERLEDYVNNELANYNRILSTVYVVEGECRVAAAYKTRGPPSNSFIGASLISRFNADIAVIIRSNGGLSLRSRRINVQKIALELGGGGHPRAAGARILIPLYAKLLGRLTKKIITRTAARRVLKTAEALGVCRGDGGEPASARIM